MAIPPETRFWRFVVRTEAGCWLWTGHTSGTNSVYGDFRVGTRSTDPRVKAHRYAYELLVGPIPDGLELDHVRERGCTSTLCVNPAHLEPVTHKENSRRARLDVCRRGLHNLTIEANCKSGPALQDLEIRKRVSQFDALGQRRGCKLCHRAKALERYHRTKEAQG